METSDFKQYISAGVVMMFLVCVSGVLGLFIFVLPLVLEAIDMRSQIANLQSVLEQKREAVSILEVYDENDYRERLEDTLLVAYPQEFDIPRVIATMVTIAREEFALEVGGAESKDASAADGTQGKQFVSLSLTGPENTLKDYLNRLSKVAPLMKIVSLNLKGIEDESGDKLAELTVETYASPVSDEYLNEKVDYKKVSALSVEREQFFEKLKSLELVEIPELPSEGRNQIRDPFVY